MEQTVAKVMGILRTADEPGLALRNRIRDAVETKGWTEEIAQRILASLEQFIEQGAETMGEAMFAAMNTASKTVYDIFDFGKEHLTAVIGTLVAIGVLAILAPSVIEMLGFAELGPTEGKQQLQVTRVLWQRDHANDRQARLQRVGSRCTADTFPRALSFPSSSDSE
jgi:hypothetical protein